MRNLITFALFLTIDVWAEVGRAADVGDAAPEFTCLDDQGQVWNSRDHVGKSPVVIYFYPSDFAFCCARQAQCYRDEQKELAKHSAKVIGISGDSVLAHQLFKTANELDFPLLSDGEGSIAKMFGVPLRAGGKAMTVNTLGKGLIIPRKVTAARWTFIIGTDGRILYRETQASPVKDSEAVLEFLRNLNAK